MSLFPLELSFTLADPDLALGSSAVPTVVAVGSWQLRLKLSSPPSPSPALGLGIDSLGKYHAKTFYQKLGDFPD